MLASILKEADEMSTLESTISMLRVLPEAEVQVIFDITRAMLEKRPSPFAAVSKESVIKDIDLSTEQFARGEAREAREVISDLRAKYGL
jgi:hypothetical protein